MPRLSPQAVHQWVDRVAPWAFLAGPLTFVVVFALLRDVPPPSECGGDNASPDEVAAFRAGSIPIFVAAEVLVLTVLAGGLFAARAEPGARVAPSAVALAAGAGGAVAIALFLQEPRNQVVLGVIAGVLATAAVLRVVLWLAGRPWTWRLFGASVLAAVAGWPIAVVAVLFGMLYAGTALGFAIVATAIALRLTWPRPRRRLGAGRLVQVATLFALLVLPLALLVVRARGDEIVLC